MSKQATPEEIAKALGHGRESRATNGTWRTFCPVHEDASSKTPSLAVSPGSKAGKIIVHCHGGCAQSAVIDKLRELKLWPEQRIWTILDRPPVDVALPKNVFHPAHGKPNKSWLYHDAEGNVIGLVHRFDLSSGGKELLPMAWCRDQYGKEQWAWKSFKKPRPLYGIDKLSQRRDDAVVIVEGEKTADAAQVLLPEYVFVTWPGGGKAINYVDWEPLRNRSVIIWRDADAPGLKTQGQIIEAIKGLVSSLRTVEVPDDLPKGWDLADPAPEGLDIKKLMSNAKDAKPPSDAWIEELNKTHALVILGNKAVVLSEEVLPGGKLDVRYLSTEAFNSFYSNKTVQVGRKEMTVSKYWLSDVRRRTYKGVVFEPGVEDLDYYNLWRGFDVEPDPTGDWSLLREHIEDNVAQGHEDIANWIIAWFAQIVQQPNYKPGTSIAFRGMQGTGKTIVGHLFGNLIRAHYVRLEDQKHFLGAFNAHMANALLVHADEAYWAGNPALVGKLKGMVTSEVQRIEPKGKDSFEVNNYMRLMMTGNDRFLVPAAFEERRFAVFDVGKGRIQDKAYFGEMVRQMNNGGYGAFLHYLQNLNISTTDVGKIPFTDALQDQKAYSLDSVPRFWFERLYDGEIIPGQGMGWPDRVSSQQLYDSYVDECRKWGLNRRESQIHFGRELSSFFPQVTLHRCKVTTSVIDMTTRMPKDVRVNGYKLWPLQEMRTMFDDTFGAKQQWPVIKDEVGEALSKLPLNE